MGNAKNLVPGWLVIAALLTCSSCKGSDMSDARRNHIFSGDHGWIDLTLKAPIKQPSDPTAEKSCSISLSLNGEPVLNESANLTQAEESQNLMGYRFVAPSGKLQAELVLSMCIKEPSTVKFEIPVEKDHLVKVVFDGKSLALQGSSAYEPTSLEWVQAEILKLDAGNNASAEAVSVLTKLVMASLALNFIALLYLFMRRRRV
jgi:hypothetical protein